MEKIVDIIDSIAYEKGLKTEQVKDALKDALIKTANIIISEELTFDAEIDEENKTLKLFQKITVVADDDERLQENKDNFIAISEAKELDEDIELEDLLEYDLEFENLGRNAATVLHREFEFRVQRLIEDVLFKKYFDQKGKIISGTVARIDAQHNTYVEIDEIRGILSMKNRIKGESFRIGDTVQAILKSVRVDKQNGLVIELSRTTPQYLIELLNLQVPEIQDNYLQIESAARIPGMRAKVAVTSLSPSVDPIGSIVGVKGVRVNAVSNELNGENIDVIEYSPVAEIFVSRALSPAIVHSVKLEGDKKAIVTVAADQKSKAIGRAGVNIRLASMLCGKEIELVELAGSAEAKSEDSIQTEEKPTTDTASLEALFK